MNTLLGQVLATHSGLERWRQYNKVEATIVTGGGFFPPKGVLQDRYPRRMTAWLHEKRSFVTPYGAPDQRTMLTPDRIAIEKLDVTVVDERYAPRECFAGHQMHTRWGPLHCAYFSGDAVWTYLTTPFLLAMDGVRVEEIEAWREETETWRVAPRHVPRWMETHWTSSARTCCCGVMIYERWQTSFVDLAAFLFELDCVRCDLTALFLVR